MNVNVLGSIPSPGGPHGLTYLGDSLLHVSSTSGDSTLVRIESEPQQLQASNDSAIIASPSLSSVSHLTQVLRFPNLAPILDFVVDDGIGGDPTSTSSAQARILTCSGSGSTGSIRSVRNGASLTELFSFSLESFGISLGAVENLWNVDDPQGNSRFLILGNIQGSTKWLEFEKSGGIKDVSGEFQRMGIETGKGVLTIQSLENGNFVQVTNSSIILVDPASSSPILNRWTPEGTQESTSKFTIPEITCASINEVGQILISLRGGEVVYLEVPINSNMIQAHKQVSLEHEVSCLDISSLDGKGISRSEIGAIGFWGLNKFKLFSIPSLEDITPSTIASQKPLEALPSSILLHSFSQVDLHEKVISTSSPHVLIGLGNGSLHSYSLSLPTQDSFSKAIGVVDRKTVSLGGIGLKLQAFKTNEGKRSIWCNSDRSTVLFSETSSGGDRLTYSSTKFRDTKAIVSLPLEERSKSLLALALNGQVQFLTVGAIQKLDVKTIEFGNDNPLAIAGHKNLSKDQSSSPAEAAGYFAAVSWRFEPLGREARGNEPGGKVWLLEREELNGE